MKQISRRRFVTSAGSAGMALLAGGKTVKAQGHERLTIGLSPFINQATIFLANELGYFSKMGLDIDMKVFMDGALVVAPMLSGELQIGIMTPNAGFFNSLSRGGPFRAFLCNGQGRRGRAVTALVIRSDHYDAGIKTLADLARMKGKTAAGRCGRQHQPIWIGFRSQARRSRSGARRAMAYLGTSAGHCKTARAKAGRYCRNYLSSRLSRPKGGLLPNLVVARRNPAGLSGGDAYRSR